VSGSEGDAVYVNDLWQFIPNTTYTVPAAPRSVPANTGDTLPSIYAVSVACLFVIPAVDTLRLLTQ